MLIETDDKNFDRDLNSKALLSNDMIALMNHKKRNNAIIKEFAEKEKNENRLQSLEQAVDKLTMLVEKLIGDKK